MFRTTIPMYFWQIQDSKVRIQTTSKDHRLVSVLQDMSLPPVIKSTTDHLMERSGWATDP